jgi:hypothetical protein
MLLLMGLGVIFVKVWHFSKTIIRIGQREV